MFGGGGGEVRAKCDGVPGGDGGKTLAHHWGIHRPRGRSDHGDGGQSNRTQAAGSGVDGGGGFQCGHPGARGKKGGEHRDGLGDGGTRRYGAAFHAARETMVSGPVDVGHEETGTGGAVPD